MKSLPCNTKALTVKLLQRPTSRFNTVIRCVNTCLLNCRHTNQVYKHYKKQQVHRSSSTMERIRERVRQRGGGGGRGGRGGGGGINRGRGRDEGHAGGGRGGGGGGGGINRGRDGGHAGGRGRGRGRGRQEGAQRGPNLTNEIHTTLVDHVVTHGLRLREAGLQVQPNLSRYTVASVIRTFRLENRTEGQERQGGSPPVFTEQQEREIVNMVLANNAITVREHPASSPVHAPPARSASPAY
ncbi:transcriptional activator protein Pur-alpha-like [Tachysurus fulvidraco]|uniref:transcriptional activator protein Pur-alpha-like n=1 Tax=Tachysurus fulvidraco TaxID=1234273 RepID=UPI001FED3C1B|nr:transcriptional activator protein Pur-alpha-like [Tachysurus fulvidraco]